MLLVECGLFKFINLQYMCENLVSDSKIAIFQNYVKLQHMWLSIGAIYGLLNWLSM